MAVTIGNYTSVLKAFSKLSLMSIVAWYKIKPCLELNPAPLRMENRVFPLCLIRNPYLGLWFRIYTAAAPSMDLQPGDPGYFPGLTNKGWSIIVGDNMGVMLRRLV